MAQVTWAVVLSYAAPSKLIQLPNGYIGLIPGLLYVQEGESLSEWLLRSLLDPHSLTLSMSGDSVHPNFFLPWLALLLPVAISL